MRNVVLSILLFVAGALLIASAACAPADDRFDAYARQAARTWSVPHLQLAVVRDGRVLHVGAAGDDGRPRAADEPMPIASVTKQFTAAAILALSQKNELALDEPIAKYVHVPDAWKRVTIYQLLTNTSGIPSYDDAAGFHSQLATTVTPWRLLHFAETLSPEFPAGTDWRYSNTNFVLLGLAIEKITREPYAEHLRRTIFAPLDMRRTGACAERPLFSYEDAMRYALSIRRRGASGLGPLGTLKSFTLIAQPTRSEPRYLATYERGEVEWRFFIDRNGLIAELEPTLR